MAKVVAELSIIIVNWNSVDYVVACIDSIRRETSAVRYEIIVVDNASYDGCGERLAKDYPEVLFIQSFENLGFSGANNLGVQRSAGGVLLFLNPDTEVLHGAIDRMYDSLLRLADAGVLGCRLLNSDGSTQFTSVFAFPTVLNQLLGASLLQKWTRTADLWGSRALFQEAQVLVEVEGVSGACMMLRRELFERVGGFSSSYFMYGEDVELCFAARHAGFKNYHLAQAQIVHHGGGSSDHKPSKFSIVLMRESVAIFLRRSRGRLASTLYRVVLSIAACGRLILLLLMLPLWLLVAGGRSWRNAAWKWLIVLMWGVGVDCLRKERRSIRQRRIVAFGEGTRAADREPAGIV